MPWGVAAAAVAVGGSAYVAEQQEDATYAASQQASSLSAQQAAFDRARNEQRFGQASQSLSPFLSAEAEALGAQRTALGMRDDTFVPGRDDISALQDQDPGAFMDEMGQFAQGGTPFMGEGDRIDQTQYMEDLGAGYSAFLESSPYQSMIDAGVGAVEGSAASAGMLRSGTTMESLRDVGQGVSSQYFSNYMGILSDITGINESRRTAEQNINEQRGANYLNIYEGRNVANQNIEEQRYANYMNTINSASSPTATTNLAALGVDQGISMGQSGAASVAAQNQYQLGATAASNAAWADIAGGGMQLAGAYIGSQGYGNNSPPPQQTGSTIYGGGGSGATYGGYA